jgi:hypothetical protein
MYIYLSQLVHAHFLNVKSHSFTSAGMYELGFHPFLQLKNIRAVLAHEEKKKERKMGEEVTCSSQIPPLSQNTCFATITSHSQVEYILVCFSDHRSIIDKHVNAR